MQGLTDINVAVHILFLIFSHVTYQPFLEALLLLLFSPTIEADLDNLIQNPVRAPASYSFKWSFSNVWDDFEDVLRTKNLSIFQHHSKNFAQQSNQQEKSDIKEVYISDKIVQATKQPFRMEEEHILLSRCFGISTEPTIQKCQEVAGESALDFIERMKKNSVSGFACVDS